MRLLLLSLLFLTGCYRAEVRRHFEELEHDFDATSLPAELRTAYAKLVDEEFFCGTTVSFTFDWSDQAPHMCLLLDTPGARDVFLALAARGTPAGRLYGLLGLRLTDRVYYEVARQALEDSVDEVLWTQIGCIIETGTLGDVIEETIESGMYADDYFNSCMQGDTRWRAALDRQAAASKR